MSISSPRTSLPLLRRSPGLAEIEVLLDFLPDPLLLVDRRNKRILLANSQAAELTMYTRSELVGREMGALFTNLDERAFEKKQAGDGNPHTAQMMLIRRNQTRSEIQATITELVPQKNWLLYVLTDKQVLQQREAERQRQARLWSCLESLSLAPHQTDMEAALSDAIQAAVVLSGAKNITIYQASGENLELTCCASWGTGLPDRLPSQDLNHLRTPQLWTPGRRTLSVLQRAARNAGFSFLASAPLGQSNAWIGLAAAAGSQETPAENVLPILQVLAGTVTTIMEHHTMITNLQQDLTIKERALRIFEAAQESIQDSVVVLSPELKILNMNPSAEASLGYSSEEVYGESIENILIGMEALHNALVSAQQGIPTYGKGTSHLYRRSGQAFLAQVNTLPVKVEDRLEGILTLIIDLSEKEQIQAHAQQLEQRALLGEVTAVFAHEVRNPINNISTGLQLMALNLASDDPNQEIITRLQQDCDRLAELMKSVLSFARPDDYEMEAVDLGLLIERLIERMRPRLARTNVKHMLQIEPGLPQIKGNPRALEQVFNNLITNAIQAMADQGGTLAIKVQALQSFSKRRHIEVSVADSGPGIPKEIQERIFQPFYTTKQNGTGLGLAITKRIVTAHKGTIQPDSFPGGTVFHVQFPEIDQPENPED